MLYGINGLIDVRGQLARNANGGPNSRVALLEKVGVVVHYDGPPVDQSRSALAVAQADAAYHVNEVWGYDGNGAPLYGDGLMYHIVVGQDGKKLLCRDIEAVLWHCAAWPQNATALAIHCNIGGDQRATPAAITALHEICDDWFRSRHGDPRTQLWGHQELSQTSCPGTLMQDFVYPYRNGAKPVATGMFFPQTKHYVGGGFWSFWNTRGGLAIFGYLLTEEIQEKCEDGQTQTVQYFERARFEYWPKNPVASQVQLSRLGADALARKK